MQLYAETDIDRAIEEFSKAVGDLFKGERREIELLKSKITARRHSHKSTAVLRHQLKELLAKQIRRELAA